MKKILLFLFSSVWIIICGAQSYNTTMGSYSLASNTSGDANTATGYQSLYSNTTSWNNSAHGAWALVYNNGGTANSAYGASTLYSNYTGSYNTGLGYNALLSNSTGHYNTAFGRQALYNSNANNNSAFGERALYSTTSGTNNASVGSSAGWINSTGSYNTYIGYNTDNTSTGTNYDNTTVISARTYISTSNQILVGNVLYVGYVGGTVGWTNYSDKRIKRNIQENVPGLSFIKLLHPVTYKIDMDAYKSLLTPNKNISTVKPTTEDDSADLDFQKKAGEVIHTGFIAQDVESAAKSVGYSFSGVDAPTTEGGVYGLRYEEFVVPLVKSSQELILSNESLKAKITDLIKLRDQLLQKLSNIKNQLAHQ